MIVVDASVVLDALFNAGAARQLVGTESLHVPHLIDAEVVSGVRGRVRAGRITPSDGERILHTYARLGLSRYPIHPLIDRIWQLRDNLTAYDAANVALAEALNVSLVTADARIVTAPAVTCPITVVRSTG